MAAVRKTREQIAAERAAELKAFQNSKKTRPPGNKLPMAPAKPLTAAERAAKTKAMEAKKTAIMQTRKPVKPAPLKGPAAIKELQRQVSPSGVKKTESGAKKGLDKKYPGLYKK